MLWDLKRRDDNVSPFPAMVANPWMMRMLENFLKWENMIFTTHLFLLYTNKARTYAHKAQTYGCLDRSYPSPLPFFLFIASDCKLFGHNRFVPLFLQSSRRAALQLCLGLGVTALMNTLHQTKTSIV